MDPAVHASNVYASDVRCSTLPPVRFNPEFARPDWMIVTVMPVPPLAVRPSIMMDAASRSSDDLTYKIHDIVQVSAQCRACAMIFHVDKEIFLL